MKWVLKGLLSLLVLGAVSGCKHEQAQPQAQSSMNQSPAVSNAAPSKASVSEPVPAEPRVTLLEADPVFIDFMDNKKWNLEKGVLREFSPEWNQIQADLDKSVADISDPTLREQERARVKNRLVPNAKEEELWHKAWDRLDKKRDDYAALHKDDFRIIATFYARNEYFSHYPDPSMQVQAVVDGDGVHFYKGESDEVHEPRNFIRLTVREMDSLLQKFRLLKQNEIRSAAARHAPYSSLLVAAAGSSAAEEAGVRRATPEEMKAMDARMKKSDLEQAEREVWQDNIVVAAQPDPKAVGAYVFTIRKNTPIYLVDRTTGTIIGEVPKAAFCFEKDREVPTEEGGWETKEERKCREPREQ